VNSEQIKALRGLFKHEECYEGKPCDFDMGIHTAISELEEIELLEKGKRVSRNTANALLPPRSPGEERRRLNAERKARRARQAKDDPELMKQMEKGLKEMNKALIESGKYD
jgi:hypothetical protein